MIHTTVNYETVKNLERCLPTDMEWYSVYMCIVGYIIWYTLCKKWTGVKICALHLLKFGKGNNEKNKTKSSWKDYP